MTDVTRAEELVQTIEHDAAFRSEVEAALTVPAKRAVLDARGFQDVGIDEMRAYVERKGGTLVVQQSGHELSEQELAAIAGGLTDDETLAVAVGVGLGGGALVVGGTLTAVGIGIGAVSAAV